MIVIASDHGGYELKSYIYKLLVEAGHEILDLGPAMPESVDYPDFAASVAAHVTSGRARCGILVCGTGIGMSIAANKVDGIRAALCHDVTTARLSREHNDANVLCLGERVIGREVARDLVLAWLDAGFSNAPRHRARLGKIDALENGNGGG